MLKSKIKYIFLIVIVIIGVIIYTILTSKPSVSEKVIVGDVSLNKVTAQLSYDTYPAGGGDSKVFLLNSKKITLMSSKYFAPYSIAFSEDIVTENFIKPLGYEGVVDMDIKFGQPIDYKNYKDLEVFVVMDNREETQYNVFYNKNSKLNSVKFNVNSTSYLGISKDNDNIYVLIKSEEGLHLTKIDTIKNTFETKNISVDFVENIVSVRADFIVKDNILYVCEDNSVNYQFISTISSFNLITNEIKKLDFLDNESIYALQKYNDNFIALLSTDLRDGYFRSIKCVEFDKNLQIIKSSKIDSLPEDIKTENIKDRSIVYDDVLYTLVNGQNDYMIEFDLINEKTIYLSELIYKESLTDNKNRTLFDWNFFVVDEQNLYNGD
jgi:hypothetical protein